VETIELIRGGASLQFGPQFGGLNYVLKRETKKNLVLKTNR
jgi:Fe(3+) dicitrate transport protein